MLLRRSHLAVLLLTATVVGACGAGVATTGSPGGTSNGGSPTGGIPTGGSTTGFASEPADGGWPWDAQPTEDHSHMVVDADPEATGAPDGESLGEVESDPGLLLRLSPEGPAATGVDPCTLVTAAEWNAWTERALGSVSVLPAIVLEDGEACGWVGPNDRVRMAIGAFLAGGSTGWLDDATAAKGTAVDGLGDRATWITQWPVSASSTLVVRAAGYDVVIEMSSLEPSDDLLLAGARELATIAIGRLP